VRRRAGVGSGPNGRLVLPEDWDGSNIEDKWFGAPVVRVHRKGTPRSDWRPDWYVNLELSWVRTPISFDSQDWALDVVASTEPDGTWFVRYKDEDELAFYAGSGYLPEAMLSMIQRAGEDATRTALARTFPFDADRSQWIPDPAWPAPELPSEWSLLR